MRNLTKLHYIAKGQGNSMKPVINPGDKVFIEKAKIKNIKVGEIVVFYQNKKLVAHRVTRIKNKHIITKGDNSFFFDRPLKQNEVLGKVVKIEGKYGILNLSSRIAKIFMYWFLFHSLVTCYLPFWFRTVLFKILRGRKFIVKIISQ